jgi:hypothetical protein
MLAAGPGIVGNLNTAGWNSRALRTKYWVLRTSSVLG